LLASLLARSTLHGRTPPLEAAERGISDVRNDASEAPHSDSFRFASVMQAGERSSNACCAHACKQTDAQSVIVEDLSDAAAGLRAPGRLQLPFQAGCCHPHDVIHGTLVISKG
jgi:hypothetical protein